MAPAAATLLRRCSRLFHCSRPTYATIRRSRLARKTGSDPERSVTGAMPRAIDWVGIFPGLFALALAAINFWRRQALATWQRVGIAVAGIAALISAISFQVTVAYERRFAEQQAIARDKEVAAVSGKMDALLALVPSLAKGDPESVVAAQRDVAEIQRRVGQLESAGARRQITQDQEDALRTRLEVLGSGYSVDIQLIGEGDPEGAAYANDFVRLFNSLGWRVDLKPHAVLFPSYPGLFVVGVQPNDPGARTLHEVLDSMGIRSTLSFMEQPDVKLHEEKGAASGHFHLHVCPKGAGWPTPSSPLP